MNMNRIIKLFLLLNNCFLESNCIKIKKCAIWNKISKCFRVSGNNTHCYETTPNGTFCCSDTLKFNDDSEINFEKCISYSKHEHNIFLQKIFVLSVGLLICIVIGIIICYCRTHNCACRKQDGLVVLAVEDIQIITPLSPPCIQKEGDQESRSPTISPAFGSLLSVPGPSGRASRSPSIVSICINVMDTSFNLETPSRAIEITRRPSLRSNSSFNRRDSGAIAMTKTRRPSLRSNSSCDRRESAPVGSHSPYFLK